MGNLGLGNITFHNQAITASTGLEYNVAYSSVSTIELEILGTATSHSITLEGKIKDNWYPISGVKVIDYSTTIDGVITTKDALWQVDVTGLIGFRVNLTAVSGGNITVLGRAVR